MIGQKHLAILRTPVLGSLLASRPETLAILGFAGVQLGLHLAGLPGWACPIKAVLGIPCPGCGLTAAVGFLIHGQVRLALSTHAFAPIFLAALLLMTGVSLMPARYRCQAVAGIAVLIKLFQKEGVVKGILGLICMIYTYVWGWMKLGEDPSLKTWMLVWTAAIILGIILNIIGAMTAPQPSGALLLSLFG